MKKREFLTPDLTPLIDVVFLLLIFFLVSSAFKKEELALILNLPTSKEAEEKVTMIELNIELSTENIAFNGTVITFETLDKLLLKSKYNKQMVNIRIDENVPYKRIVLLLDILKKYNLENIALINQKLADAP